MQNRGSVLVEQLLAMALLSVMVVSLFSLLTTANMAAQMAHDVSLAAGLAARRLEEVTATLEEPVEVPREPFDPRRFPRYQWEVTVSEVAPALRQVTVTVSWLQRGRERSVSLTTLVRRQEER